MALALNGQEFYKSRSRNNSMISAEEQKRAFTKPSRQLSTQSVKQKTSTWKRAIVVSSGECSVFVKWEVWEMLVEETEQVRAFINPEKWVLGANKDTIQLCK